MQRVQLASDFSISKTVHGLMHLSGWNLSKSERLSLIKEVLDTGITTFDHADIYGSYQCEALFGEALALEPSLREKMELVTKCGIVLESPNRPAHRSHHYNTGKAHIISSVEQSLINLSTDTIDLLLIHRPDPFMNPEETAAAFDELHRSGKVRHFGVSNFKRSQFNMLESYIDQPLLTNQIELSPYNLENFEDGTVDLSLEKKTPPMAWSPLAGGKILTGTDEKAVRIREALNEVGQEIGTSQLDEVIYAWLYAHPANISVVAGTGKIDRIRSAAGAQSFNMDAHQWFRIYQAVLGHDVA
ncbi:aldo/keto reductase [Jeotgalibacillus terrae]|uniref:Aldo/keto reductase family oxidoreductase n=1 Tax=Jeotgalibacillus terrae TaxID=587735 RepID=A0ABW5ZDW0_9BACL|nr:aldo/keto reductase [Jeotgalibacillus terrae]MBM7580841.1 putative oxidoreductase [Jeotgalibacillus terrae]